MSKLYKTALGKSFDMAALRAKNERVRAVGNMNVNARGDIIDSNNNVISDVNKRVNVMYEKTMQNPTASRRSQPGPNVTAKPAAATATPPAQEIKPKEIPTIAENLVDEVYKDDPDLDDDLPNPEK